MNKLLCVADNFRVTIYELYVHTCSCIIYWVVTVQLEHIDHFASNFHKYINIAINVFHIFPIMLALCLMPSVTNYSQNYVGIIGGSLILIIINTIAIGIDTNTSINHYISSL